MVLSAGSLILADGIVLEANDFFVNQAVLTGETFPVEKKPAAHRVGRKTGEYQAAPFDCIVVDGKVTAEN